MPVPIPIDTSKNRSRHHSPIIPTVTILSDELSRSTGGVLAYSQTPFDSHDDPLHDSPVYDVVVIGED